MLSRKAKRLPKERQQEIASRRLRFAMIDCLTLGVSSEAIEQTIIKAKVDFAFVSRQENEK